LVHTLSFFAYINLGESPKGYIYITFACFMINTTIAYLVRHYSSPYELETGEPNVSDPQGEHPIFQIFSDSIGLFQQKMQLGEILPFFQGMHPRNQWDELQKNSLVGFCSSTASVFQSAAEAIGSPKSAEPTAKQQRLPKVAATAPGSGKVLAIDLLQAEICGQKSLCGQRALTL